MRITPGRTVLYVLTEADADAINRRRTDGASIAARIKEDKWPLGAQAHIGNTACSGDVLPAVAVKVIGDAPNPLVNLQVFLDGNDTYWATSRYEDVEKFADDTASATPGRWFWPPRS